MRQKNAYWKIWSKGGGQLFPSPRHYPAAFAYLHFGGDCPRHLVPQLMRSSLRLGKQERVRKGAVFWLHNLKQKSQIQNSNEKRNPLFFALKWKKKCRFLGTKKIINGYFYVKSWKLPLFSVFTVLFSSCSKHTFFWYNITATCNCKAGILILWANVSLGWNVWRQQLGRFHFKQLHSKTGGRIRFGSYYSGIRELIWHPIELWRLRQEQHCEVWARMGYIQSLSQKQRF